MNDQTVPISTRVIPLVEKIKSLVRLGDRDPLTAKRKANQYIRWLDNMEAINSKEVQLLHMAKEAFRSLVMRTDIVMSDLD